MVEILETDDADPWVITEAKALWPPFRTMLAGMIAPLSEDRCPMPDYLRTSYGTVEPTVAKAITPELLAHRDFIYDEFLELPVRI